MRIHLTKLMDFLSGLTEGFTTAILFGAIVVVFLVTLTEWVYVGRMP